MGYEQHQQSRSSGALVATVVAVLLIAVLGIVAVAGAAIFWVKQSSQRSRAIAAEQRAVAELHLAEAMSQQQQASITATPDPRLNFEVTLDREGNTSIDGEKIGLDELRAQLTKLKDETSNAFSVYINADSECPVKHIVPVLAVCKEVGDIDFSIVSSKDSDSSSRESNAEDGSKT